MIASMGQEKGGGGEKMCCPNNFFKSYGRILLRISALVLPVYSRRRQSIMVIVRVDLCELLR